MGALLCLVSAAAFGAMAIFGKLAFGEGLAVGDSSSSRFALAAAGAGRAGLRDRGAAGTPPRGRWSNGLLMGAVGYATQSGLYFLALERMDASLLALLLYTYPAMVTAAAHRAAPRAGQRGAASPRWPPRWPARPSSSRERAPAPWTRWRPRWAWPPRSPTAPTS